MVASANYQRSGDDSLFVYVFLGGGGYEPFITNPFYWISVVIFYFM